MFYPRMSIVLCVLLIPAAALRAAGEADDRATAQDVARQARKTLEAVKSYTFAQKEEYEKRLQQAVRRIDRKMDDLKRRAEEARGPAREELSRQMEKLARLRDRAEERLKKVKEATPGAWEDVKKGAAAAVEDLRRAFEKAGQRYP